MAIKLKAFIDSDVLLDVLLGRQEFIIDSSRIVTLCENNIVKGYTSVLGVANMHYVIEKYLKINPRPQIEALQSFLTVLSPMNKDITNSFESGFSDFEDGIQNSIAERSKKCDYFITRNTKDFQNSNLIVCSPTEFLENHY